MYFLNKLLKEKNYASFAGERKGEICRTKHVGYYLLNIMLTCILVL